MLSFLNLVNRGHNGDFNFHIGWPENRQMKTTKKKCKKKCGNETDTPQTKPSHGNKESYRWNSVCLYQSQAYLIYTASASYLC